MQVSREKANVTLEFRVTEKIIQKWLLSQILCKKSKLRQYIDLKNQFQLVKSWVSVILDTGVMIARRKIEVTPPPTSISAIYSKQQVPTLLLYVDWCYTVFCKNHFYKHHQPGKQQISKNALRTRLITRLMCRDPSLRIILRFKKLLI